MEAEMIPMVTESHIGEPSAASQGPWRTMVDVLGLDYPETFYDPFYDRLSSNYRSGLRVLFLSASRRSTLLGKVVDGIEGVGLERFLEAPGASQLIWWSKEAAAGRAPDPASVDSILEEATRPRAERPRLVSGAWTFFDNLSLDWGWPLDDPDPDVLDRSGRKIRDALALLGDLSPVATHIVKKHTGAIVARSTVAHPTGLCSASHVRAVGISVICNGDVESVTVAEIAERLFHESIHDVLYKCQFMKQMFTAPTQGNLTCVLSSPWSGNDITLENFLHASFVWFGLHSLWRLERSERVFGEIAESLRRVAERGFRDGSLLDRIPSRWRSRVAPEVTGAIDAMQARVMQG